MIDECSDRQRAALWELRHSVTEANVRDDGGIYTKAYGAVYYKPFFEKTGIEVVGVQANAEPTAQIKSMVEAGSYAWDMAKISQPAILLLTSGGKEYLEKHGLESDRCKVAEIMSDDRLGASVLTPSTPERK